MSQPNSRGDIHPTDAPQPIPTRKITDVKPGHIKATRMQGAANAVAEWISDGVGELLSWTDPEHVDDDIAIVSVDPDDWDVCKDQVDASQEAVDAMRLAHNATARKHGLSTATADMMVIPRSVIPDAYSVEN